MTAPALARPARPGEPGFAIGGRVYEHPRTKMVVPSITAVKGDSVIKEILGDGRLEYWTAGKCATYASENIADLAAMEDDKQRKALIQQAPWNEANAAASVGDIVHDAIDQYIKGAVGSGIMNPNWPITAKHMWQSFIRFVDHYQPEWVDSEFTVWSNTYGYAGTMDWAARIRGWLVLGDTKTGKTVHPDFGLQLAAGVYADFILRPDGTELPIPQFNRCAVLHVRPRSAELVPMDKIAECWEAFKAARVIKYWHDYHADRVVQVSPKITAVKEDE